MFSEDRTRRDIFDFSEEEIINCQRMHLDLIERIGEKVSMTKRSRFMGFMSPNKLYSKFFSDSQNRRRFVLDRSKDMQGVNLSTLIPQSIGVAPPNTETVENSFLSPKLQKRVFSPQSNPKGESWRMNKSIILTSL